MLATSQGTHLVLPGEFFPGNTAMIVPKTPDGRVIFVIPWHQHAIVGTTDTPIPQPMLEPRPRDDEIQYLLDMSGDYLSRAPTDSDVLGYFTGIRPLVRGDKSSRTASLSRDHVIRVASSGLITIAGGKWTTYRKMAEDCVDRAIELHRLKAGTCQTKTLKVHGATDQPVEPGFRGVYGTDLVAIQQLELEQPPMAQPLSADLDITPSLIVWAVRQEMAWTVDDVLARRTRSLFLNPRAALAIAPEVARIMAVERGENAAWCQSQVDTSRQIAEAFLPR
jgi:glycerol-3-phosphate dehydrogenase